MKNKQNLGGPGCPCYTAEAIADGEEVPVRGTFPGKLDLSIKADFDTFGDFFEKVRAVREKKESQIEACRQWLQTCGSGIDPGLFMALYAFQVLLHKDYPNISASVGERSKFYSADRNPRLSDLVKEGCAKCSEFALLAHGCLNRMGIENRFVLGAMAWDKNENVEAHNFLIIPVEEGFIIFCPANPTETNQGLFPALYHVDAAQAGVWEKRAAHDYCFMEVKNILTGKIAYYGIADSNTCFNLNEYVVRAGGEISGQRPQSSQSDVGAPKP